MNPLSSAVALHERERVRQHLMNAERGARARPIRLEPVKAANRALLLDELRRYRRRGRFPLNRGCRTRAVPQFIDSHGTRCAVAHLMEISGQGSLVRHIANTENDARVARLARLPELRAWLAAAGLRLEEAARIQPNYCFLSEAEACFCNQSGLTNLVFGTIIAREPGSILVRIDRVEGDLPGLSAGDEQRFSDEGEVGEQRLFHHEAGSVQTIAPELRIENDEVRCLVNPDTFLRPVTLNTTFEALLAERSACIEVLAMDDSDWNQSQCREPAPGGAEASESEQEGCGLAATVGSSGSAMGLTSVALFAALFAYRCRRRRGARPGNG